MRVKAERPTGRSTGEGMVYGPHMRKNPREEKAIKFLEDARNNKQNIPTDLLLEDEIIWLNENRNDRLACAEYIREKLQGGGIG